MDDRYLLQGPPDLSGEAEAWEDRMTTAVRQALQRIDTEMPNVNLVNPEGYDTFTVYTFDGLGRRTGKVSIYIASEYAEPPDWVGDVLVTVFGETDNIIILDSANITGTPWDVEDALRTIIGALVAGDTAKVQEFQR